MNFLGMGPMELLLILVLALVVFGPGKLPEIMGQVGRAVRDFQRATRELSDEFSSTIRAELEETKAALEETKAVVAETRAALDVSTVLAPSPAAPAAESTFTPPESRLAAAPAPTPPGDAANGTAHAGDAGHADGVAPGAESPPAPSLVPAATLDSDSAGPSDTSTPATVATAGTSTPRPATALRREATVASADEDLLPPY